ncbi:reticulon-like protein B5 [Cornus florida]|uniref:reticulon-like protein B5 n=1 Tax=Cornus florida TaxID=4283 RepID=UPI0028973577|nr:reticulon-like protein B5 [Cornus florida]
MESGKMSDPVVDAAAAAISESHEKISEQVEAAAAAVSETLEEKIKEAVENHVLSKDASSSIQNEIDKHIGSKKYRLFGRQKPVHAALGGGKPADIILWRNKQISAGMLASVTVIWFLFEWNGYHFLTFVCHSLILSLATLFLWSNISSYINKPLNIPEIVLPEDLFKRSALFLRCQFNQAFAMFREVASGKDLKKFLYAITALWVISVVGSWFDFLTLIYIMFVMLLTLPFLYEMNEDPVDAYAEKAHNEFKKQYKVLDETVLQKLPKVPFTKSNKQH